MSRIDKLTLALAALVVFGLGAPAAKADACTVGGNIVNNCGFETGNTTGWTVVDPSAETGVDAPSAHSGGFGLFSGPVGLVGTLTQNLVTVPGQTYTLSFWLTNESSGTPNSFQVSFNGVAVAALTNSASFGYTLFTINGLLATGASTQLQFGFQHNPSFWDLDDVIVVNAQQGPAVPEPMTLVLLGTGLAGVATKLRRRKVT